MNFSPDDGMISYLFSADGSLTRQLYAYDSESGQISPLIETVDRNRDDTVSIEERIVAALKDGLNLT